MFTHITVGTNDIAKAGAFYDAVLEPLGIKRLADFGKTLLYGIDAPQFMVTTPYDGNPATIGNGMMIGLVAPTRAAVDEVHARALSAGGKDEGGPGPRPAAPDSRGAYIRDLDGNKLAVFCHTPE